MKQRIQAAERTAEGKQEVGKSSFLADLLLEKWAWGELSPQEVQQFASAACKDIDCIGVAAPQDLQFLSGLGTSGIWKNNMHKELMKWANSRCSMAPSTKAFIKFKAPYGNQLQSMLLPHQLFSTLYHEYHASWKQIILPSKARLEEFWHLQKQHPAYSTMTSIPDFQSKMVPLALHGDGTTVVGLGKIWSRQLTIFSWNSMLGLGSTKDLQLHLWSVFDETMNEQTLDDWWTLLGWSLTWLRKGLWPNKDHLGKKLLDKHMGTIKHKCCNTIQEGFVSMPSHLAK